MEQRRLRLGDILDDYCPRERRVTNHAVVAMIEDKVQQTRCTTCDAEHVYKGAKEPRRRSRKDSPEGLFREVLAGMPDGESAPAANPVVAAAAAARPAKPANDDERSVDEMLAAAPPVIDRQPEPAAEVEAAPEVEKEDDSRGAGDDGPFHRRLIRAQLPRIEGQKEIRQEPDFSFRTKTDGTRTAAPFRSTRGPGGGSSYGRDGRGGQPNNNGGNRPNGRRFAGGGNPGMPGSRGPGGPGRGPSGPGRGPAGRGGGRPGPGGPANGSGRGPSNGPPRGGPRKRSR